MTPAKIDLTIYQGATFRKALVMKLNGVVANLTGYTARMQIRASIESDTTIADLTTENGGITITGAQGKIDLLMTATATNAMTFSSAVYDLELVNGEEVLRFAQGRVSLIKGVTR